MVVQTYKQIYMVYKVIKQAIDEKVKVYYGHILKFANCLNIRQMIAYLLFLSNSICYFI
jgi:hypothetical protein